MPCKTCGRSDLKETEYVSGTLRAPALECLHCRAMQFDEAVARSDADRDSVRLAVAARRALAGTDADPSPSYAMAPALPIDQVEGACSEIDVAVVQIGLCLEFLTSATAGDPTKAAGDARAALKRIQCVVDDLSKQCARSSRRDTDE